MDFLTCHLHVLAAGLLFTVCLIGIGHWVLVLVKVDVVNQPADLAASFWVGYCVSLCVLQWASLVIAMSGAVLTTFLVVGLLCACRFRSELWGSVLARLRESVSASLASVYMLAYLANASLKPVEYGDCFLYHIAHINWMSRYPATPGLVNLGPYLGYNLPGHLFNAMWEHWPWDGRGWQLANYPLCWLAWCQGLFGLSRVLGHYGGRPVADRGDLAGQASAAFLLPMFAGSTGMIPDPHVEGQAAFVAFHLTTCLSRLAAGGRDRARTDGWMVLVLGATLAVLKLTNLPLGGTAAIIGVAVALGRTTPTRRKTLLPLMSATGALILLPGLARSVILSGYPFFPMAMLRAPVGWRMDDAKLLSFKKSIDNITFYVHSCIRFRYGEGYRPMGWALYRDLFHSFVLDHKFDMLFGYAAAAVVWVTVVVNVARKGRADLSRVSFVCLTPVAVYAPFWLAFCPAARYAGTALLILLGCGGGMVLAYRGRSLGLVWAAVGVLWVVAATFPVWFHGCWRPYFSGSRTMGGILAAWFTPPGSLHGLHPLPDRAYHFSDFVTDSGLVIYVAPNKTSELNIELGDVPPPCAIAANRYLRLIDPPHLSSGFVIDPPGHPADADGGADLTPVTP